MAGMASGQWYRLPLLVVVDSALPESHRTLIKLELKNRGAQSYRFPTTWIDKEVVEMRNNLGYSVALKTFPYKMTEAIAMRLIHQCFKNIANNVYPHAVPMAGLSLAVNRPRDLLCLTEQLLSRMDFSVFGALYGLKQNALPPVLLLEAPIGSSAAWDVLGHKLAAGVVLATTDSQDVLKSDYSQTIRLNDEEGDEFATLVSDVSEALFEEIKRHNK